MSPMRADEINRFLADFAADPAEVMDRVPDKRGPDGRARDEALTAFDDDAILTGGFVGRRDRVRADLHDEDGAGNLFTVADLAHGKAPIHERDRAEALVDEMRYERPADVEAARLLAAQLPETPWSDDYWGIFLGILGRRYADPGFPASDDWRENHDYVLARPATAVVASRVPEAIDALSPAEKYDLLVGDEAFGLTRAMWAEGQRFHEASGTVETWMGICHGWAPASYMLPRPRRRVRVQTPGGLELTLYPADIKALASLLWANAPPPLRFIGSRCEEEDPEKDENGRVRSAAAFDNNPGTFFLALVNQIGACRRSLVMDATYDYEVWNQPVCGYEIHWFNPQTMAFAASTREGTVGRGEFSRDRFSRYRAPGYASALGVAMRVRYVLEKPPSHAETDAPEHDATASVDYYFDLELDGRGRIVGGEWYLNRHPDFLWTPAPGRRALSPADDFVLGEWDGGGTLPESHRAAAARASADGIPLATIVEPLIALARR